MVVTYCFNSQLLLDQHNGNVETTVDDLIPLIRSGVIWFPFQRYYRSDPWTLFNNLKTLRLQTSDRDFYLRSYYPRHNTYLPPLFRGKPLSIMGSRDTYLKADVLSDFFIEDYRLEAKRYDQEHSILECWNNNECIREILTNALKKPQITPSSLRDTLYETIPEAKVFNPTWARELLFQVMGENLVGKKWLDISAGWGDRLLTAMSLDMDYVGFDPNYNLWPGHSQMIQCFGNPKRHKVIYEPFEKGEIPEGEYDVVLSSPPYFNLEEYAKGQEGQSIVSFPKQEQWMVRFLFVSLFKAWDRLKIGGYLILHLGDAKTIMTAEAANLFIENHLPGSSWEGLIGLAGEAGYPRPVWVWKKVLPSERKIWNPNKTVNRTLQEVYPEITKELEAYIRGE